MKAQATAKLKGLRIAPRKVRLVVDLIRGRELEDAYLQLQFSKKHAAKPILKLIKSAVANAVNNHDVTESTVVLEKITVDGGPTLHRFMPRAMGRAFKIRKRTSHITVVVSGDAKEEQKTVKTDKNKDIKETKSSTDKDKKNSTKKTTKTAKKSTQPGDDKDKSSQQKSADVKKAK